MFEIEDDDVAEKKRTKHPDFDKNRRTGQDVLFMNSPTKEQFANGYWEVNAQNKRFLPQILGNSLSLAWNKGNARYAHLIDFNQPSEAFMSQIDWVARQIGITIKY